MMPKKTNNIFTKVEKSTPAAKQKATKRPTKPRSAESKTATKESAKVVSKLSEDKLKSAPFALPQMLPSKDEYDDNDTCTNLSSNDYSSDEDDYSETEKRRCGIHSRILYQLRQVSPPKQSDDEILAMIREGNPQGHTLLFYKHYKYILEKIINATHGRWYSDDILQAGAIGLFEAAARFDPKSNNKFLTYAHYWILKYIYIEMRNELLPLGGLGIGRDAKERLFNYIKCVILGLSDKEIMEKLHIGSKALTELKMLNLAAARIRSLDSPEYVDNDTSDASKAKGSYNQKGIPHGVMTEDLVEEKEFFSYVESRVNELRHTKPELAEFLEYELGINGREQLDKTELCELLCITKKDYEAMKREGNKYLRTNIIKDGWYDAKQDLIEKEVSQCVIKVNEQLQ